VARGRELAGDQHIQFLSGDRRERGTHVQAAGARFDGRGIRDFTGGLLKKLSNSLGVQGDVRFEHQRDSP
jgi:hypothetical protein